MQGMITLERPGRIRGITWTTNALAQIYYDKTLHVGDVLLECWLLICQVKPSRLPLCSLFG
jgi:hypothetical protein